MRIVGLNHFNIATRNIELSARFYEALGLVRGPRPDFGNTGIWMYYGADPILHLNDANEVGPIAEQTGVFHHVGLSVKGSIEEVTEHLRALGVEARLWEPGVPGWYRAMYFKGPSGEEIELVLVDCYVPALAQAAA